MEEVIIDIDEQGNSVVSVKGIPGPSCKKATAEIEKALGTTTKDKLTGEFYAKEKARVVNRQ